MDIIYILTFVYKNCNNIYYFFFISCLYCLVRKANMEEGPVCRTVVRQEAVCRTVVLISGSMCVGV